MAFFRCIRSGNVVEFTNAYDVETTRRQIIDYVEVDGNGTPLREEDRIYFKDKAARSKDSQVAA